MEIAYHAVNLESRPDERERIERELGRVADVLRKFPRPSYHVEVERSPRKGGFGVSLHVNLSTRSLFANAWGGDLRGAVEATVDKVVRQAKRHLSRLRENEKAGAATPRNDSFFRETTAAALESIRDLEEFRDQIGEYASRLHKVLRRERRLDPRSAEVGGAVSLADVVEDAIAYVFEHWREKPASLSPDRWLVRRGLILLDAELDRAKEESTASSSFEAWSEPQEAWEELMNLPVEEWTLLDGTPADRNRSSPEIVGNRNEAEAATARALTDLPHRQRVALLLRHVEGYAVPEIGFVLNADDAQVESWLDEGEVAMQERLRTWRPT